MNARNTPQLDLLTSKLMADLPKSDWHSSMIKILSSATRVVRRPAPGLYLAATPIGNAADISVRALATLAASDVVLCEDTRVTAKLLSLYDINIKLQSYHDHNAATVRPLILKHLQNNAVVVQVSDAGTPLINDPGYKLVLHAVHHGIPVTTLPGATSPIAALTLSGLPTDRFLYAGFPPAKTSARRTFFDEMSMIPATLVFLESARRLPKSLEDMIPAMGLRQAAVCRELTKKFEEIRRGTVQELSALYAQEGSPRGETVLVVGPPLEDDTLWSAKRIDTALRAAIKDGMRVKEAATSISDFSGWRKQDVYRRAVWLSTTQE